RKPRIAAPTVWTNRLGAVIATSPARSPLPLIEASGLPKRIHMYRIAPKEPVAPAIIVLTAIEPMRRLPAPDAPRVLPGLNPNHPKARMKHPSSTIVMSWPGIAFGEPSRLYLPIRGPMIMLHARALSPPTACTTPDPAKSQYPWPSLKLAPSCESQPPPHAQLP